jgi:hypothetical protein
MTHENHPPLLRKNEYNLLKITNGTKLQKDQKITKEKENYKEYNYSSGSSSSMQRFWKVDANLVVSSMQRFWNNILYFFTEGELENLCGSCRLVN